MTGCSHISILYMDDDPGLARMFQKKLQAEGYDVDTAPDGEAGLSMMELKKYDIIAVDYMMPVMTGLDVIRKIAGKEGAPPVVMVTGTGSEEIATQALKLGAADYVIKDVDVNYLELLPSVFAKVLLNQRLIREKKEAEEALRASEEKYRALVECARDGIIMIRDDLIAYANMRTFEITGHSPEEILGKPFIEYIHPDEVKTITERYKRRMTGETIETTYETALKGKNGEKISVEFNVSVISSEGNKGLLAVVRDITERKLAELEMTRLRRFLQQVIDSMPSAIISVDTECRITRFNLEAERLSSTPFENAKGKHVNELFPQLGTSMDQVCTVLSSGSAQTKDRVPAVTGGEKKFFNIMVYPLADQRVEGAVIRLDDVTAFCKIEEMMFQSEKMTSILGLAAGMAHEINNPLSGIILSAENILRRITPEKEKNMELAAECGVDLTKMTRYMEKRDIPALLTGMKTLAARAGEIIDYLLLFSRGGRTRTELTDAAQLIENILDAAAKKPEFTATGGIQGVRLMKEIAPEVPHIPCNSSEIELVLMNLIKNAAEAVKDMESPAITVRLKCDGGHGCIEVEDNGPGMDGTTLKRIFDPFYTTKKTGVGQPGLGLSVAYVIVTKNHGGTISAESVTGSGSKFIVRLPLEESMTRDPIS